MKKYIIAIFALILTAATSYAQIFDGSGNINSNWNGTPESGKSIKITGETTVNLGKNINLYCTIDIRDGGTLIINNTSGAGKTIYNKAKATERTNGMFVVREGGKLVINGADGQRITLGGGGNFPDVSYDTSVMSGGLITGVDSLKKVEGATIEMNWAAIHNNGIVELNYVTIQNICNTFTAVNISGNAGNTGDGGCGGAILHNHATLTKMDHCLVNKVLANTGAGVWAVGGSNGQIIISNSEFKNGSPPKVRGRYVD